MKRTVCLILSAVLLFSLASCGDTNNANDNGKLSIVTTVFPEYDWIKNILGDVDADVKILLDNGVDLHSYQPTADDIVAIANADVFVYVGGESDGWVDDAVKTSGTKAATVSLMDVLGENVREEEVKEGMQAEDAGEEDGTEYDEHVWLSLKNARIVCSYLAGVLSEADPDNAEKYAANVKAYAEKIDDLDRLYGSAVSAAKTGTLVFADRFPFLYLTKDYNLDYYAAFVGCSSETGASFETVKFLADKVDELGLSHIMILEGSDGSIAGAVADAARSDVSVLAIDSMQSVNETDIANGVTYLSVMTENLDVLKEALS